ncbi:hypothetical protein GOV13_05175 [Candidatus Pacearchaeota archaeon]|nr:hypothetical protein [Candidatus Pacearchaeota archaeon]
MIANYENFEKDLIFNDSPDFKNLVNFDSNLSKPYHRWYKFKEGFASKLVERILYDCEVETGAEVIDCFCGSGTSVLTCQQNQINSTGVEINPFLRFLSYVKTRHYFEPEEIKSSIEKILEGKNGNSCIPPNLDTFKLGFSKSRFKALLKYKGKILGNGFSEDSRNILLLGLGAILEDASKLRKDGKALRIVENKKRVHLKKLFSQKLNQIYGDISNFPHDPDFVPEIYEKSSIDLSFLKRDKYKLALFSPPYLNTFDYLEVYKMELWMLDFISSHSQRNELREKTVRSHISVPLDLVNLYENKFLDFIVENLKEKGTWDSRIPTLIKCYFEDMYQVIDGIYKILENDGHCVIVVGNSSYANIPIPTDSILAKIGKDVGFDIKEIKIARHTRRSSQQYPQAKKNGMRYLRESIVILKK